LCSLAITCSALAKSPIRISYGGRREWILREQLKKALGLWLEVRGGDLLRVFLRLLGENDDPTHQPGLAEDLYSGSAMSFRIESRIPGIETR